MKDLVGLEVDLFEGFGRFGKAIEAYSYTTTVTYMYRFKNYIQYSACMNECII